MANTIPEQVDEALQKGKLNLNDAKEVIYLLDKRQAFATEMDEAQTETKKVNEKFEEQINKVNERIKKIIDK